MLDTGRSDEEKRAFTNQLKSKETLPAISELVTQSPHRINGDEVQSDRVYI